MDSCCGLNAESSIQRWTPLTFSAPISRRSRIFQVYDPLLGVDSFDGASLQCKPWKVHQEVKEWVEKSAAAGRPWICSNDEQGPPTDGVLPDDADDPNHDMIRRDILWGTLMAGGSGEFVSSEIPVIQSTAGFSALLTQSFRLRFP